MKKIIIGFTGLFILMLQSCLKDSPNVDFSNLGYVTEILYPPVASAAGADATGSGLSYFSSAALTYPPTDETDTSFFIVNLASPNPMGKDLSITVAPDNSKLNDNFSTDSLTYVAMPDSVYKILNPTGTIRAGQRLDTVWVVFYPSKIDASQNYGLPISITSADGTTISSNFGTLYYHTIGNPLAGVYDYSEADPPVRYSYTGTIDYTYPGPYPPGYSTVDLRPYYPKLASPDNSTTIEMSYANGFANYVITFDPSTLAITNVGINPTNTSSNFIVYYANYDVATKTLHIISHYNNAADGSGNDRIIDETMVKQ